MKLVRVLCGIFLVTSSLSFAGCEKTSHTPANEKQMDADDALLEAVMFEHPDLDSILNDSALMNLVSDDGIADALTRAARNNDCPTINHMLKRDKIVASIQSQGKNFAFHWAAIDGHIDVVKLFIHRPDINKILTSDDVSYAVWYACDYGHHLIIREILNNLTTCKLISTEMLNKGLGLAIYKQHDLVVEELLGNKNIVGLITRRNANRVLRWAAALNNLKIAQMLFACPEFCEKLTPDGVLNAMTYANSDEMKALLYSKSQTEYPAPQNPQKI